MADKYSLWVEFPHLQPVVDSLAREVGNSSFVPHMTLAAELRGDADGLAVAVGQLAESLKPIEVAFKGLGTQHREHRFLCLLAMASPELDAVYARVIQAFPSAAEETFREWPHVSLMYGTRAAVLNYPSVKPLQNRFGASLDGRARLDRLSLWRTQGDTAEWRRVADFPLQG